MCGDEEASTVPFADDGLADGPRCPSVDLHGADIPTGDVVEELGNWRPDIKTRNLRQDLVMSMWFCWLEWQRVRNQIGADAHQWDRGGLPWVPTANPFRRSA